MVACYEFQEVWLMKTPEQWKMMEHLHCDSLRVMQLLFARKKAVFGVMKKNPFK